MKKEMSFARQMQILKVSTGVAWIVLGILHIPNNLLFNILETCVTVLIITNIIRVSAAKREYPDEMADINLLTAKANTLDIMHSLFLIMAVAVMMLVTQDWFAVKWSEVIVVVFYIIIGIEDLTTGIIFRKLENE